MTMDIERRVKRLERWLPPPGGARPRGLPASPATGWEDAHVATLAAAAREARRDGIARPLQWMGTADLLALLERASVKGARPA